MPLEKTKVTPLLLFLSLWNALCPPHQAAVSFWYLSDKGGRATGERPKGREQGHGNGVLWEKLASNPALVEMNFQLAGVFWGQASSDPLASNCCLFCHPCIKCSHTSNYCIFVQFNKHLFSIRHIKGYETCSGIFGWNGHTPYWNLQESIVPQVTLVLDRFTQNIC